MASWPQADSHQPELGHGVCVDDVCTCSLSIHCSTLMIFSGAGQGHRKLMIGESRGEI